MKTIKSEVIDSLIRSKPIWRQLIPSVWTVGFLYILAIILLMKAQVNVLIQGALGKPLSALYQFLSSNCLGNLLTTLMVLIVGGYLIYLLSIRKTSNWLMLICLFFTVYIYGDDDWLWAISSFRISYKWLILVILFSLFICRFVSFCRKLIHSPRLDTRTIMESGFSSTTQIDDLQDTGWTHYIQNLTAKLLKTDLSQECFAVGISGPWGSGKTTFLNAIEKEIAGHVFLFHFNPWNSDSPAQISADFFRTINSSLSIPWNQRRVIARYARILSKFSVFDPNAKVFVSLFDDVDSSISEAKEKAADVIGRMPLPVVILIDDLDRLDGPDIMAVLRLIRVTANFRNLIFVVAYDKVYVSNVLSKVSMSNGGDYLKKIFPLEVCLPSFESFVLANHLYNELKFSIRDNDLLSQLEFPIFKGLPKHKVSFYLPTFRDVKRFVNQFSLNVNSFVRVGSISEIDVCDLFYLELLHYYDIDAYQYIQNNPTGILQFKYNIHKKFAYSFSTPGSINGDKVIEEKDEQIKSVLNRFLAGVDDLLWAVFGRSRDVTDDNLARYPTNFAKYFSYRINKDIISLSEFNELINLETPERVQEKVKEYCRGDVSKKSSLSYHLTSHTIDDTRETQVFNHAYALIELALYGGISAGAVFKALFEKKRFSNVSIVASALTHAVKAHIGKDKSWNIIQEILTSLVECHFENPADPEDCAVVYESVLSWDVLQTLSEENFLSALKERSIPIQLITDERSLFHAFLKKAVAQIGIVSYDGEHEERVSRSLLNKVLLDLYSKIDNKNGLDEFFKNLDPRKDDIYVSYYEPDELISIINNHISLVFGNMYKNQDFYSFIGGAFAKNEGQVNSHLKSFGLPLLKLENKDETDLPKDH